MGQFDSASEAGKARLEAEENSGSILSRVPGLAWHVGEIFADLLADDSPISASLKGFLGILKALASHRFEKNVDYMLECVLEDLKALRDEVGLQRDKLTEFDSKIKADRFREVLIEAAVQAARAPSRTKIARLARVVVSGSVLFADTSIDRVFEFERHCVELIDNDVHLLNFLAVQQPEMSRGEYFDESGWAEQVRHSWLNMRHTSGAGYIGISAFDARSSFARLQSRGLICQLSWGNITAGRGADPYGVLDEGRAFLKFLRESK